MFSSDPTVLQRFLDGELDAAQAELVARHVESCDGCRSEVDTLAAERSFIQTHLGHEDDGQEEAAAATLQAIATRLRKETATLSWWRSSWVSSAAVIGTVLMLTFAFGPTLTARPTRILEEAASRHRSWMYEPNKVLAWEVDAVSRGVKSTADGRWRTLFWQKNGPTTFRQISRQYDPTGNVTFANWMEPDGSTIAYRPKSGRHIEISPPTDDLRQALFSLSGENREALDAYLAHREMRRSLEFYRGRDIEWLHRPSARTGGTATVRIEITDRGEEVFHIRVENRGSEKNPAILLAQHDYQIERSTLRIRRLRSTISYADGTTGVHDARWSRFREISKEEFEAQAATPLLRSGVKIVHFTPEEIVSRAMHEAKAKEKLKIEKLKIQNN